MKHLISAVAAICFPIIIFCQDITGLWSGTMANDSSKQSLTYEVFIGKDKGKYSGYSQTCFLVDGEKYNVIKKIKVNFAKDGKLILLDAALVQNNYPSLDKNVKQLNVLDLVNNTTESSLDGLFVTNLTKSYAEVTGHINLKRTSTFAESSLMRYLHKGSDANDITVAK